ncbi:ABC transporter substrate-binding protein [Paenirhodobacter populi]|uniref:Twin-arginine translocation signal domain-containing protein n=1 Tax=Paenirhodobacter populi TaxID=2306993 RepID=A0A443J1L7_9RHOB|nr:ABC transporter substrate-binding protein [Sinirhodobacter populi]RWR08274.1 twin-arginine translocation signal domain-containing protein [Sinirhodobacter populi]RWR14511.1 twin-arginine translocation signal domain-containing protein [Sinirhodobacter populi]
MSNNQPTRREFLQRVGIGAAAMTVPTVIWSPAHAAEPHFKIYLTIFNNQQTRMIWTDLIGKNIAELGVEVVTSYVPPSEVISRRANETGATYTEGGFDMYSERIYYSTMMPLPDVLFSKAAFPPFGKNFYRVEDDILEQAMETYSSSPDPQKRAEALKTFEHRWYDIQPLHMVFYPEDVIAINPDLEGFDATTYNPVFFPRPENWTITSATGPDVSAAFACWQPPTTLVPMYSSGYNESNIFGPVYNSLMEYDSWETKKAVPALAESVTASEDGLVWTIKLREGVKWHSGEEFTADDVIYTWDTILDPAYASVQNSPLVSTFGSKEAYEKVSPYEIKVTLPKYSILFEGLVLTSISIMPKHAYASIGPEEFRKHTISTWTGGFTVTTSDGKTYEAKGAVGTGPWIPAGFDAMRKAYRMVKNPDYWKETTGNVTEFFVVNIQGADAVLSALKAGEIDAHDPMYDIGTLVSTIEEDWGKVLTFDSYKWQQTCLNLKHPVFGTGVDTPLGKQDPSRAAEAAVYVRQAISHAIPREQIIKNLIAGYGKPGTVPMPVTAEEYDHDYLKPIPYDLDLAKSLMEKAGYKYA